MVVVLLQLYQLIPFSMTFTLVQGHSNVRHQITFWGCWVVVFFCLFGFFWGGLFLFYVSDEIQVVCNWKTWTTACMEFYFLSWWLSREDSWCISLPNKKLNIVLFFGGFVCLFAPQWGAAEQKLKFHLVRTQSLNVLPLKPGVGQYIATHTTLTARDFFLISTLPVHSPAFFPKPILIFPVLAMANTWFLCRPAEWNRSPCWRHFLCWVSAEYE